MSTAPDSPRCSVVIPAHNEADHIATVLGTLLNDTEPREFEVVVVCNGSNDNTAEVAREFNGVRVEVIEQASKIAALNHGDATATAFPRIYLDGDTRLSTAGARAMAKALEEASCAAVAGLSADYDLSSSSWLVRHYVSFRQRLPVFSEGIIGAGVYAMNRQARGRFGEWPPIIGDDQFVLRMFSAEERRYIRDHRTIVEAPQTVGAIIRRGVRVRRGNAQLAGGRAGYLLAPPDSGWRSVAVDSLRDPSRWAETLTWLILQVVTRLLSRLSNISDWGEVR